MVARLVFLTLFLVLGVLFISGKGTFLISGYYTMSKEGKVA